MLSLALMEAFRGKRIYVSLQVTRQSLFEQIPWLSKLPPGEIEVIDSSAFQDHVQEHVHAYSGIDGMLTRDGSAKSDETFLHLPAAVQAAWAVTDPVTPTIVVFDSWDAVIDQYLERPATAGQSLPSRPEIERKLLTQMSAGNISIVLVMERAVPSVLDYYVNGIVETSQREYEGRLERWLSILKLRGIAIATDRYPFSLAKGRFSAITATPVPHRYRLARPVPDPTPTATGLWPGSSDYADVLGRPQPGEMTLMEFESAVPRELPRVILGPMLLEALELGGRVLIIPPPSADPEDSFLGLRDHIPIDVLRHRLRVLVGVPPSAGVEILPEVFVPHHRIAWTNMGPTVPLPADPEFLFEARGSTGPNVIVAFISGLEALAEGAGIPLSRGLLAGLDAAAFPHSSVHTFAVARSGQSRIESLGPLSEQHIRIRCPHGRVFLYGHRPYLAPLLLSQEAGPEPYHLTQVL
jgi:KaiC/GvpD/RAD55 family RecA-like ATPase